MQTPAQQKLDFFLTLAFMDQQLGVAIYDHADQLQQIKNFILRHGPSGKNFYEVSALTTFQEIREGWGLFHLSSENLSEVAGKIKTLPFPGHLKVLFVISTQEYEHLHDDQKDLLHATFNPIFHNDL